MKGSRHEYTKAFLEVEFYPICIKSFFRIHRIGSIRFSMEPVRILALRGHSKMWCPNLGGKGGEKNNSDLRSKKMLKNT